ncbi:MAG: ribonuclease P protein component [Candidatus Moranbacteria bacterium]|nr:ribonuclease P protein component [Candidatus Moranbacteria bacterium]
MVPRVYRLKNPLSVQKAFRYGKPFFFGNVSARILFNVDDTTKIACVSAKKTFRLATDRNRARRILSESIKPFLGGFPSNAYVVLSFKRKPEGGVGLVSTMNDIEGLVKAINSGFSGRKQYE